MSASSGRLWYTVAVVDWLETRSPGAGEAGESVSSSAAGGRGLLELVVRSPGGRVARHLVKEQVTIGRAAACDLIVEEAGVNLIHGRVVVGEDGGWELVCVGRARVELQDAPLRQTYVVDRVALSAGTKFWISGIEVECVTRAEGTGAESATSHPAPNGNPVPPEPTWAASASDGIGLVEANRILICLRCFRDLTGVPVMARYCPKCGGVLPPRDSARLIPVPEASSPLFGVYEALREDLTTKLVEAGEVEGATAREDPAVRSLIVLAYASALLNLGWRYENGKGLMRNLEEAARCYAKAGRLREAWEK